MQRGERAEGLRRDGDGRGREIVAAQHAEHDERAHADGGQDPHRAPRFPCKARCSGEQTVTGSWQSCDHPSRGLAADALQTAAMAFLRRHNRALLCIAAGLLLSALTYQPPV